MAVALLQVCLALPVFSQSPCETPEHFSEGLSPATEHGKWGYVDRKGKIVIPFQFEYASPFDAGMARVVLNRKAFFINKRGSRVTPTFDGAFGFHEGLAAVVVGDKVGYIRKDGTFAIPPVQHGASGMDFSEGLAAIRVNGKVGFMDHTGRIVIQPKYDDVYPFSDGLAPVKLGGKWGYVDKSGNLAIPIQYQIAHMFSEEIASVALDGKWHYIKPDGSAAFPATFDSAMPFCGGVAKVQTFQVIGKTVMRCKLFRGKRGVIDHSGNYVWRDAEDQTWRSVFCP
jgi:WG containing repeat